MEEMKATLTKFEATLALVLGQMADVKDDIKKVSDKVVRLEEVRERAAEDTPRPQPLIAARTEYELKEIARLPDCVRELQVFEGEAGTYDSWMGRAETILKDYEIIKERPLYRSIVVGVRQKIRGNADTTLMSYNVADDDWSEIKRVLALHYADKRDLRTLEYQMGQMTQGAKTVEAYYSGINSHFALIIRCLKNGNQNPEILGALVETYRDRALDVFIRGLSGDLSKLLVIRSPKNLPEAYAICLELRNLTSMNHVNYSNRSLPSQPYRQKYSWTQPNYSSYNNQYQYQDAGRNSQSPQRYSNSRAIKMEPHGSGHSYRSNQSNNNSGVKRSPSGSSNLNPFRKSQRLYQLNAAPSSAEAVSNQHEKESVGEGYYDEALSGNQVSHQPHAEDGNTDTVNFMADASLAFHT